MLWMWPASPCFREQPCVSPAVCLFFFRGQDDCIEFLMKSTKVTEFKAASLLSIGRLCRQVGSHLSYRIDELVSALSAVLLTKNPQKKMRGVPSEALKCISDMVCGMGECLGSVVELVFLRCGASACFVVNIITLVRDLFVLCRRVVPLPSARPVGRHAARRPHGGPD